MPSFGAEYLWPGGSKTLNETPNASSMTIQIKASATEQYFPVVLFIMLYKVVLNFEYVDETLGETVHMKATKQ